MPESKPARNACSRTESAWTKLILCLLLFISGCSSETEEVSSATEQALPPDLIALNNRGVGEMGRFDYGAAASSFEALLERWPEWSTGRVNLAIALLNRQQPGDESRALEILEQQLAAEPQHLAALYVAGILQFNSGQPEAALSLFSQVVAADPKDAFAAYFAAQCLLQSGQIESSLPLFEQALLVDPYLRSAYYGAFLAHQRLGNAAGAQEMLQAYQRLEANPRSYLAEIKYTRMGPRASAAAVRDDGPGSFSASQPLGPLFGTPVELTADPGRDHPSSATIWHSADQGIRLLMPGEGGLSGLSWSGEAGALVWQAPFAGAALVNASAWGDFDNDGLVDLYLAGQGGNALWRQTADKQWEDVTRSSQTGETSNSVDAVFFDADHDGDLDLFVVNADAPNELFSNNLDGTFRRLASNHGLAGASDDGVQVLAADFDADRDTDLLVLNREPPHEVYINDRLWRYHAGAGFDAIVSAPLIALAFADADVDGSIEFYALNKNGELLAWQRDTDGTWQESRRRSIGSDSYRHIELQDFDGDTSPEILLSGGQGWQILSLDESRDPLWQETKGLLLTQVNSYPGGKPGGGPAIIDLHADGLRLHPAGVGRFEFLTLDFSGAEDHGKSMRSNRSGIGTRYVLRSGNYWSAGSTLRNGSGPGQSLQPAALGLAGQSASDYLEIDWSDGVFQTELGLRAGQFHRITETQRQLASCPIFFAWDGEAFRFISDVLGVGGIGFAIGPGEYATPRPLERYRLPESSLVATDGYLRLKLAEPMEEIAYIDSVTLTAVDYPSEAKMVLDERMATSAPAASGKPLWYRNLIRPLRAIDANGIDRLPEISVQDREAAPPGAPDPRFVGLLATEQVLELEFGRDLSLLDAPALLLHGWIEYPYSQTSFAAWQAGRAYEPPSLETATDTGEWTMLASRFGYPAGMPREAALPLPDLPIGTTRLRLRTTQQIYWDQLAVVETVNDVTTVVTRLPVSAAAVKRIGFPRRSNGPQLQPDYDFAHRSAFWDTRYQRGFYTAFGPATELIAESDNALAIIGPGDALDLEFAADLPTLPKGWERSWILEFTGWAKDMDLYTLDGETVAPLPSGMRDVDRSSRLHPIYNTRFQSGR
jgi:tetratricopeptide (TPR) repeat protein